MSGAFLHLSKEGSPPSKSPSTHTQETPSLTREWTVDLHKCLDASPVVACLTLGSGEEDGRTDQSDVIVRHLPLVFIGSHSHEFFAIEAESGRVHWVLESGDRIEGSAIVTRYGNDKICVAH